MKIYTKTGDDGTTSLYGGMRVKKYNLRIKAYGTVDELNSYIGLISSQKIDKNSAKNLLQIQNDLFTLGSMLATPQENKTLKNGEDRLNITEININSVQFLEKKIDAINEKLPIMKHFILPKGNAIVSYCHIARCICRRAERISVELNEQTTINRSILVYLNRLSDYLFVLARKLTYDNKIAEIPWIPKKKKISS